MSVLELKIPPPVVMLLVGVLMWLASSVLPASQFAIPGRTVLACGVALAGLVVAVLGFASFRRAGTTVDPRKPGEASSLVVAGVYKLTRNPMYLGDLVILIGWAMWLSNALAFVFLPVFVLYINRFQIEPEERALAQKFGSEYAVYKAKVRRWL
jgi:protein-S-isoprenylcysteine O-methyltransferase Ste14